jgi:hypothetical protein
MAIKILKYEGKFRPQWESFVTAANNGTIFHRQQFLDYHPKGRFDNHHLTFFDGHSLLAVMPALIKDEQGTKTVISYGGASYGGLVMAKGLGVAQVNNIAEAATEYWARYGAKRILITQPPLIYQHRPDQYIDFSLAKQGYSYLKREITAVIPLDFKDEGDMVSSFRPETRTSLRKAQRVGISVSINENIDEFYDILEKNLEARHNVKPTHTLTDLKRLKKLLPENILQFTAYLKGRPVAGITVFVCNPKVILAFYISHDQKFQEYRPVNSVYYHVIKWGRENGFKYLDLGTFTLNMQPNWGLGRFKEGFGARGYLRETFELRL